MDFILTLACYGRDALSFPALVGASGCKYGRGIWNAGLRRHEIDVLQSKWCGEGMRGTLTMQRDVFNNLRRAGAQWIVASVRPVPEDGSSEARIAELTAELDATRAALLSTQNELNVTTELLMKATPEAAPPPDAATPPAASPDTAPTTESAAVINRRAELSPRAYRDLRAIAKDDAHQVEITGPVSKEWLIEAILRAEKLL